LHGFEPAPFGAFIINVEISTNRLTRTSQKIGTHPTIRANGGRCNSSRHAAPGQAPLDQGSLPHLAGTAPHSMLASAATAALPQPLASPGANTQHTPHMPGDLRFIPNHPGRTGPLNPQPIVHIPPSQHHFLLPGESPPSPIFPISAPSVTAILTG
jgi:hypothetical protein